MAKKAAAKKKVGKKRPAKKPVVVAKKAVAKKANRKTKEQPASNGTTKAQSIRDIANELGKKARPKDIIAALAEKGITVTSPQVSMTLKAAGLRRGRRKKKVVAAVAARTFTNGHDFNIDDLMKVKTLANELGGIAKLKELAAALAKLS